MASKIDLSQFKKAAPQANAPQPTQGVDLSQFKKPEEKRGAYETYVERPGQIAAQSAVAGLRAIPRTGLDLIKSVVTAAGGDISKLEEAQKNAPDWLKNFASKAFPSYEEVRADQAKQKAYKSEKPLAQPEGAIERGVEKFGRFIGEAPAFGGVGGIKGAVSLGGLATGIQIGEEAEMGPIGQLALGVAGSVIPSGAASLAKTGAKAISSPKQTLAKGMAKFTPKESAATQKKIIENARKAGVQLDAGSITNSNMIKQMQSALAQSGLTGKPLERLKNQMQEQIVSSYKTIADDLGKAQFDSIHDAGATLQTAIKAEKDASRQQYRDIYQASKKQLSDASAVYPDRVISLIGKLESELKPGSLKGTEQKAVLSFIQDLKKDVMDAEGKLKPAKVKDLINDKIAIHDIVDYEIEGGTKELLKQMAKEIDSTIQQYGRENPQFAKDYKLADKKFGEHVRTFRNKNIGAAIKAQDPRQLVGKMNTTQGIKDIKKSLEGSQYGKELFNDLARFKLDQMLMKNFEEGMSNQIKFGTFSNVLKKANNREVAKELLDKEGFKRLDNLTKTSGVLAESANKFLNTSQSSVRLVDLAFAGKLMSDIGHALTGNPFPLMKTGGIYVATNQMSKLLSDPVFLKLLEEAVIASKSNNVSKMAAISAQIKKHAMTSLRASPSVEQEPSDSPQK